MIMSEERVDVLTELVTLGIGRAGEVLNLILNSHIILSAPVVRVLKSDDLASSMDSFHESLSAITMRYKGSMDGLAELIFKTSQAGKLVDCITGDEHLQEEGMDALRSSVLCEIGNIVINALMGAISNELEFQLQYTVPTYIEGNIKNIIAEANLANARAVLLVRTVFNVASLSIEGEIAVFMSLESLHYLELALDRYAGK